MNSAGVKLGYSWKLLGGNFHTDLAPATVGGICICMYMVRVGVRVSIRVSIRVSVRVWVRFRVCHDMFRTRSSMFDRLRK